MPVPPAPGCGFPPRWGGGTGAGRTDTHDAFDGPDSPIRYLADNTFSPDGPLPGTQFSSFAVSGYAGGMNTPMSGGGGITVAGPVTPGPPTKAGPGDGGGTGAEPLPPCNPTCEQTKKTKICGPDVTNWLRRTIAKHLRIRPFLPARVHRMAVLKRHVLNEGDFTVSEKGFAQKGPCPRNCPQSVTLCDICVNYTMPEDLSFAIVGHHLGFSKFEIVAGANAFANYKAAGRSIPVTLWQSVFGPLGGDSTAAHESWNIGLEIAKAGLDEMCRIVHKFARDPKSDMDIKSCPPCPKDYKPLVIPRGLDYRMWPD